MKFFIGLSLFYASLFGSDVDAMIKNIMAPKNIVSPSVLASLANSFEKPVVVLDANATPPPPPKLQLQAILDGSALINDKWLKIGDNVNGYKISHIGEKSVIIGNAKENKTLHIFKVGR
jgi:hypothetical protein